MRALRCNDVRTRCVSGIDSHVARCGYDFATIANDLTHRGANA